MAERVTLLEAEAEVSGSDVDSSDRGGVTNWVGSVPLRSWARRSDLPRAGVGELVSTAIAFSLPLAEIDCDDGSSSPVLVAGAFDGVIAEMERVTLLVGGGVGGGVLSRSLTICFWKCCNRDLAILELIAIRVLLCIIPVRIRFLFRRRCSRCFGVSEGSNFAASLSIQSHSIGESVDTEDAGEADRRTREGGGELR